MKFKTLLTVLLLVVVLALVSACRGDAPADDPVTPADPPPATPAPTPPPADDDDDYNDYNDYIAEPVFDEVHPGLLILDERLRVFPTVIENPNPILPRGAPGNTLRLVVGSDATFPGLHNVVLSSEAFDSQIMGFQMSPLVYVDAGFMFVDGGIANLRFDVPNNAIELTQTRDVFWHDGVPFTLDDLVFAYELMARNNYHGGVGVRFVASSFVPWVIGIEEFRTGQVDYIAGMVLSNNNRTLRIYYDRPLPPSAQYAGGIWLSPTPRHHLEPAVAEVGWGDLHTHPRARHEALGFGPWIIESIVPGESVIFRANDNYHRGAPLIDYIYWSLRPTATWLNEMAEGLWDIGINGITAAQFETFMLLGPPDNQVASGQPATGNGFLYFRTGTFDFENNESVPRPPGWHPIQNVAIRRAIAHAMPQQMIADTIQNGLSVPAGTIMNPFNARPFIYAGVPGFFFDLDHSRAILDEAGFNQFGPDGFRLDLDGNPMYFVFAANDNAFNQQAIPIYLDHWRQIGLDVRLHTDDLVEWNTFLENILLSDNWSDDVHMFISNWSMGWNPAPHGLWAHDNSFNMARHTSPEMIRIFDDMLTPEAFDRDFLAERFRQWQMYAYENAIANQMFWGIGITPVNNRVSGWNLTREPGRHGTERSNQWGLTAPTAYVSTR